MPRKVSKTDKPALLFVERPAGGARLQHAPEVRAAINPKNFFPQTQTQNSSSFNSWVNPQFSGTVAPAPPARRGRRRCQSATSILDACSQPSRKKSVCKFPSLSFQTGSRECQKPQRGAERTAAASDLRTQPRRSRQNEKTDSKKGTDAPKDRRRNAETSSAVASHCRCLETPGISSIAAIDGGRNPADGASTPASEDSGTAEVGRVDAPPDVDAPDIRHNDGRSSSPSVCLALAQPCTPSSNQPPDSLVADTPERDYGLKVTWRRRRGLMLKLKERGHLSESETLIHKI